MRTILWVWFGLLVFNVVVTLGQAAFCDYPRERKPATPAMDMIGLLVACGLIVWILLLLLTPEA